MRTVLLDGDIFIFAAASANEYECQWSTWLWTLHADFNAARAQFDDTVDKIVRDLEAERVVVALTDPDNWRKRVMPSYKHNRIAKRKPVVYQAMREYVAETRETFQRPGLEGDDVLGILSTHKHLVKGEKIIVSLDKDMQTIPGLLLNDGKARERIATEPFLTLSDCVYEVTAEQADRYHMMQTLTGDPTDGYPGCPGIGAVKAAKLLDEGLVLEPNEHTLKSGPRKGEKEIRWEPGKPGTPWQVVVSAYAAAGLGEEVALQNARVARIARASDYDFENKEIKLWHPE